MRPVSNRRHQRQSGVSGRQRLFFRRFWRRTRGAAAVEFALVSILLFLVIGGILDLGHAWYMRQVVTNASREGARYGITFRTDTSGNRVAPSGLTPTIQNYILTNYLASTFLPADANPTVSVVGAGYTSGAKGQPIEVTVSATKSWFLLSSLIPGWGSSINIAAATVMLCE